VQENILKSFIKHSEGLVRELEVEVPADKVDATFAEYYHKYRKDIRIPGFRPGKAPLTIIKSKFQDSITEDVLDELIRSTFEQAIKDNSLDVASRPTFPNHELKEGTPLKYTIRLEVMPQIDSVDYSGLSLPESKMEVEDSEVNDLVEHLRKRNADIRPVNRPAKSDDILKLNMKKLEDPGNVLQKDEFNDVEIDLSSELTMKDFRDGLTGATAGDDREITINYPSDYSDERFAGKMLKYYCHILSVSERVLPEISDSFAKQMGKFETMLELRLRIREDIKAQKESDQLKWKKHEITHQIVDKNPLLVPEGMIQNYLDNLMEDFKKNYKDFDEKVVREQYRPSAVNAIKWYLLSNRLAELEKIEVLPIDTENWIKAFALKYQMDDEKAKEVLSKSGRAQEIRDSILEDKIFDFLLGKVTFVPADKWKHEENAITPQDEAKEL